MGTKRGKGGEGGELLAREGVRGGEGRGFFLEIAHLRGLWVVFSCVRFVGMSPLSSVSDG